MISKYNFLLLFWHVTARSTLILGFIVEFGLCVLNNISKWINGCYYLVKYFYGPGIIIVRISDCVLVNISEHTTLYYNSL